MNEWTIMALNKNTKEVHTMNILGFDIGGTKCAVTTAQWDGANIRLLEKAEKQAAFAAALGLS